MTLTKEAAAEAGWNLVDGEKGKHAVHEVVVALQANRRSGSACAKKRSEVAASGKKPWRQKGTGRARAGSASSPVWVGGGVVFGPRPRDYSKRVPKKVKRLAFRKALTERLSAGDILVVENLVVERPKTKDFVAWLTAQVQAKRVLVIGIAFDANTFQAPFPLAASVWGP
ncbi:MAG: 50S ribosomal protein L4, partial [Verrucomicrobiia bacterium]